MKSVLRTALLATGLGVTALAVVALIVTFAPFVQGQAASRDQSLAHLRAQILGGSQIGVDIRDVDATDVKREKLDSAAGAIVEDVRSGSPAAKAGIKAGDVIVSFDGEAIRSARQLSRLVEETADGREVAAVVVRNGQKVHLKVAPVAASTWAETDALRELRALRLPERLSLDLPVMTIRRDALPGLLVGSRARLGVGVLDLTDQLGEYFGAKGGVLVTEVDEDTPAQAAGLRAGDVIVRVGTSTVSDAADLRRALAEASGDTKITIVRNRKEQTLTAKIDTDPVFERRRIVR